MSSLLTPTRGRERWKDRRTWHRDEGWMRMRRDALEDAVTFGVLSHLVSQTRQGQAARGLPEDCHHVCKRERALRCEQRAHVRSVWCPPAPLGGQVRKRGDDLFGQDQAGSLWQRKSLLGKDLRPRGCSSSLPAGSGMGLGAPQGLAGDCWGWWGPLAPSHNPVFVPFWARRRSKAPLHPPGDGGLGVGFAGSYRGSWAGGDPPGAPLPCL